MTTQNLDEMLKQLNTRLDTLEQDNKTLREQNETLQQEAHTYAEELATTQEEVRHGMIEAWLDEMTAGENPRMFPAEVPFAAYILDVLTMPPGSEVKTYAAKVEDEKGQLQDVELTPAQVFMAMYEGRSELLQDLFKEYSEGGATESGGEPATQDADPRAEAISRAKKYAQEKNVPLEKAYRIVLDEDPELKERVAGARPEGAAKAAEGHAEMSRLVKK
jgi:small-conductance mechanosensitive channel